MEFRSLDAVLTQQVFITGQVQDALSGRPPLAPPAIALVYQATPDRPYALEFRQTPEGHFAFFGNPRTAFPAPSGGATLDLRLLVSADRYQSQTVDLSFDETDLAVSTVTRQIAGQNVEVPLRTNLPVEQNVSLQPVPVHLAGRVVDAADPTIALANAEVQVTAPEARGPVTTNAGGYFTLQDMPVAAAVTVRVTLAGFDPLETAVSLDYRQPVNRQAFALESS